MARKTRPIATVCNFGLCTKKATTIANNGIAYCRDHARLTETEIIQWIADIVGCQDSIGADRSQLLRGTAIHIDRFEIAIRYVTIGNAKRDTITDGSYKDVEIELTDGSRYRLTIDRVK
jgi:hypothetical protein